MTLALECYKTVKKGSKKCIPCKGFYFQVERDEDFKPVEELKEFETTLVKYKEYKSKLINRTEGKTIIIEIFFIYFFQIRLVED